VLRGFAAEGSGSAADLAMERYAEGDDAAFALVYDALAERLLAFLRRRLGSMSRAEDLLQQTFLRMHRARGSFVSGSAVLPWAFAIARRLLIDELRRAQKHGLAPAQAVAAEATQPSREPSAQALLEADELARRLQRRLAALPASQRVAFELTKLEGLSAAEAAQVLGMTVQAVKLRAHRASIALRGVLDPPSE
jgi:RNA polymerase sigma-70 factor (ECF subfamily)